MALLQRLQSKAENPKPTWLDSGWKSLATIKFLDDHQSYMANSNRKFQQNAMKNSRDHSLTIEQALSAGDIALAAKLAERALAAGKVDPLVLNLAAWRREEAGDYAGAHDLLRRALGITPGDPLILGSIGAVLRKQGFLDEALSILDQAVAIEPRHAAAWLERGYVLDDLRDETNATLSYERALALDNHLAPAFGKLADAAARRGDAALAQDNAARALALNALEPAAISALAMLDIEARDGKSAEKRLKPLLASRLVAEDRIRALTMLGDALDRQDRTADAFKSYQSAQRCFRETHRSWLEPGAGRPSHRSFIERIRQQVEQSAARAVPADGDEAPDNAAANHLFLLGYPRSGTTLVENILASAPGVVALEERDTFADVDERLLGNDGAMLDLEQLDPALVRMLRASYWSRVSQFGAEVAGRSFVDMNPFNAVKLPIIARLFPRARIIIMRRDPRDIVLSCFRINFTPGTAAWAFSDLPETARHYNAMMELIDACRAKLPLAFHELRYDRLVADFEPTVRSLADFAGLDWTDDFKSFDRTANRRGVRTASETQVRRGLYNGGGQWRRYERQLAPTFPILAPWIDRFGSE